MIEVTAVEPKEAEHRKRYVLTFKRLFANMCLFASFFVCMTFLFAFEVTEWEVFILVMLAGTPLGALIFYSTGVLFRQWIGVK